MSFLDKITRGRQSGPVRLLVYGEAGAGKSTFAAGAPSALFIDCERRTDHLDIARIQPDTWDETLGAMRELVSAPGTYKTIVVDTLDHMELLIHKAVCDKHGWATIEEPPFGKGYIPAVHEWSRFLVGCDMLRSKGMSVVMLAHSTMRTIKNPQGEDYDRITLKLKGGQRTNAGDLIKEKSDLVGFAHFEDVAAKSAKADPTSRAKARTSGRRLLTFAHNPAYESKLGIPMAPEIPLSWTAFADALTTANNPQESK